MTGAEVRTRAIAWLTQQIGRHEEPVGSNHVFVWADVYPAFQGQPWCMATVQDAYLHAGVDLRRFFPSGGAYYCPSVENFAKANGLWKTSNPVKGDIVLYGANGIATHTGLADPISGTLFGAIEGNTSPSDAGSQINGDGIYRKARERSFIRGWVDGAKFADLALRRGYTAKAVTPVTTAPTPSSTGALAPFPLPSGHWFGPMSSDYRNHSGMYSEKDRQWIRLIQKTVGLQQDGIYGPITKSKVMYAQTVRGLKADGLVGAVTWNALKIRY